MNIFALHNHPRIAASERRLGSPSGNLLPLTGGHTPQNTEKIMTAIPFQFNTKAGVMAFIRGHVSTSDESIKDRKFQVSTEAGERQQDLDGQAIDAITAIDIQRLIETATGQDIPITVISAAAQVLEQRVKDRKTGKTKSGPIETIPVAVDKNGRVVLQAIKHQRTGEWSLSLGPVAQVDTWFTPVSEDRASSRLVEGEIDRDKKGNPINLGSVDHKAVAARRLIKSADKAMIEVDRFMDKDIQTNDHKKDLKSICALINKVLPRQKGPDIRSFKLIGNGAIKCDSVSIGGHKFTDMLSVVVAFRPDLVSLFNKTQDQSNG